jgi:hypothetical protein
VVPIQSARSKQGTSSATEGTQRARPQRAKGRGQAKTTLTSANLGRDGRI